MSRFNIVRSCIKADSWLGMNWFAIIWCWNRIIKMSSRPLVQLEDVYEEVETNCGWQVQQHACISDLANTKNLRQRMSFFTSIIKFERFLFDGKIFIVSVYTNHCIWCDQINKYLMSPFILNPSNHLLLNECLNLLQTLASHYS